MKFLLLSFFGLALTLVLHAQVVNPTEFQKGVSKEAVQVLDVRTPSEFKNGHLQNSLQADWNNQAEFKERIQYVDKSKPVYVYCAAGVRSKAAANWMRSNGFTAVTELEGGINAWNSEKKPTEGVAAAKQITAEEFATMVSGKKNILVDFGAPWCPPCKSMEPVIAKLKKDGLQIIQLDPTVQTEIASQLNIKSLPTFLVFKSGKESFRKAGVAGYEELKKALL